MSVRVSILCGPARCGKTGRLLARYREALKNSPPGAVLWLAPTWRAAAEVRGRLLDGSLAGCFQPGVMTFDKFADTVLLAAGVPVRRVSPLMKRELVRRIIDQQTAADRLEHFQSIAHATGMVDLVCEFIGELKRLEIWPEDFQHACAERGIADKDIELFEVYEAYQQMLREHGLYDDEGRFWSARDELRKAVMELEKSGRPLAASQTPALQSLFPTLVVADGFTDFTRTQHEILKLLADRAEELIVTLPLEDEPRRNDLFAKPLKTLAKLRRQHPHAAVETIQRAASSEESALSYLERSVFVNPRERGERGERREERGGERKPEPNPQSPILNPSSPTIEILAAARQIGEIEMIGARIKRLLIDGQVRPGEIAVVFHSPQEVDGLLGEVFGRLGIPAVFESGQALDRSPVLRALTMLLQLDLDDWPFDQLLSVLGSNYFQPDWPAWQNAPAAVIERTIRGLQIPHGRKRLMEQLTQNENGFRAALELLKQLGDAFDTLPQRVTLPEWAKAWERLAQDVGMLHAMEQKSSDQDTELTDRRAWNRLMEILGEGDTLAGWLEQRPPELDRREAFEALMDILRSARVGHAGDESGQVRVLSATSARSLRIPYLFLAGLSEKVFPPPDREDRLYSEAEYVRLINAGLPLVARTERTREEMLLFYEALTRATKRLYLSYPALDEAAQPLLPSPFLNEVEQAFGPARIPRVEQIDLSPVPRDDEPLCDAEFRVKSLATALEGNVALLAGWMRGERGAASDESPNQQIAKSTNRPSLAAGLEQIYMRQDRDRFGPAEGVLQGEAAGEVLAVRFPPRHTFAATDLERYASCPFRFFLERMLKLKPIEDLALEFDVLNRGRVVHEVLAQFHRRINERLRRPGSPLELDAAESDALLNESIEGSLPPEPTNPVQAALREVDRRLVVEWLSQYREQCEKYDAQWKSFDTPLAPELFEVSFGRDGEPPPSTGNPLEFVDKGETIRIAGRVDRIDVGVSAGQTFFNVLDYKTGGSVRLTPESIRAGTTLQLPLYSLAAAELLLTVRNALPWRAGYWYVREGGFKPRQALSMYRLDDGRVELESTWEELRAELGDIVAALVQNIRGGRFPVCSADEHCTGRCPYATVCRINQVRSLEKTCLPTATE